MTARVADPTVVVPVDLRVSTAYAVRGVRTVLVDTGPTGAEQRLLRGLERAGIHRDDVALIVLTHCHPDHAGGAARLRETLGAPVAVHRAESGWAAAGRSEFYQPLRPFGRLLLRTMAPYIPRSRAGCRARRRHRPRRLRDAPDRATHPGPHPGLDLPAAP